MTAVDLGAGKHVHAESGYSKHDEEDYADQKGDKLRRALGRFLAWLGNPESIDKGVGEKEKWFHNVPGWLKEMVPVLSL